MDWIWGIIFLFALIVLILLAELVRKLMKAHPGVTRKFVHIVTGLFIAITPFIFETNHPILAIAFIFIPVNYYAIKHGMLKSIHTTIKPSYGTVYYPIAFLMLTYFLWAHYKLVLVISFLILGLADALAAIVGERLKKPLKFNFGSETKSLQGSLTMFVASFTIVLLCLYYFGYIDSVSFSFKDCLWIANITAVIAAVCESVSHRGSDNLTVPLGAAFTLHYMISHHPNNGDFTFGLILALFIAIVSYRLKFLDGGGSVATFLLGVVVFGVGGWKFTLPILAFFILSSLLSKLGKQQKQKISEKFQKSSRRDLGQVLANGGIAGLAVLLSNYFPGETWYPVFVSSVAAATADTWGTEIGVFSKVKPRNILNFKKVPTGSSGGITILGTAGALLGSMVIAGIAGIFVKNVNVIMIITISGFVASIVDSLLGATVQSQYQCPNCHKITEKTVHCNTHKTKLVSGWRWIDNDVVNGICTLSGAILAWIGWCLLM